MNDKIIPHATLVGNFMRRIGLGGLSETYGKPVTFTIYRGIPFIERKYDGVITWLSTFNTSLNCRPVIKNVPAIKFCLNDPTVYIEIYLRQDGEVHIQVYECSELLDFGNGEKMPVYKSVDITWNGISLGSFNNLEKP